MEIPSINIKDLLVSSDHVDLTFEDNLHIGREPGSPADCVTIFDTADAGSQLINNKNDEDIEDRYEYSAVLIRVRNKRYHKAMKLAKKIVDILHGEGGIIINGTKITVIESLDNPSLWQWDDNDRAQVVANFSVQQTTPST